MENPKKRNWKVLTSEYLARKPWFTVRHESIELPDGRRIPDYYVFEYPDWVNVIAITKEGKFVFIDQYRHGLGETDYEIPAGVADKLMPQNIKRGVNVKWRKTEFVLLRVEEVPA